MSQPTVTVPVKLTAYSDKSFIYVRTCSWALNKPLQRQVSTLVIMQTIKTPPATYFIKKAAGLKEGSQKPGHTTAAELSAKAVYEIAKVKHKDTPRLPLQSVARQIAATCASMGVKVTGFDAPAPALEAEQQRQ